MNLALALIMVILVSACSPEPESSKLSSAPKSEAKVATPLESSLASASTSTSKGEGSSNHNGPQSTLMEVVRPAPSLPSTPISPPSVSTPAIAASAGNPSAPTVVKAILVKQEDSDRGVIAKISRIATDNKRYYFSATDDMGVSAPNQPCEANDRFEVEPTIPMYLKVGPLPCAEQLTFKLASVKATYALVVLGNDAMLANDFATAQVYFATASQRLNVENAAESADLFLRAQIAAGKSLGVSTPTTTMNGVEVLNEQTYSKLRDFQKQKYLPMTGVLDSATAAALAGVTQPEIARRAAEVPNERIQTLRLEPAQPKGERMRPGIDKVDAIQPKFEAKNFLDKSKGVWDFDGSKSKGTMYGK